MRKRKRILQRVGMLLLMLAVALLSAGCARVQNTGSAGAGSGRFYVYYSDTDNTGLVARSYKPKSESFDGIVRELLEQFRTAPDSQVISALPGGVSINGYSMGVDNLTVDFNVAYLGLNNVQEVLARAGIVKTLVQLDGVRNVFVTVDSQPLSEPDGTPIGAMNADTFVENQGDEINSYRHADMKLYFADSTGEHLIEEERSRLFSSNLIPERIVVENVLKGPEETTLRPIAFSDVPVNNVYLDEAICVVDLGSRFNETNDSLVRPEVALYALVNSLMDSCDIEGVRIEIDGSSDIRFRSQISLDQTFTRAGDLIADLTSSVNRNTVVGVGAVPDEQPPVEVSPAEAESEV